ncbi:MAG: NTP transferase domain-containing protein [Oscillospiraceae bacterium]|nr:NTP transferase domain-containing protein [Oscillospiraceae bacterium]
MRSVVMAGGEGSRLRPLTCDCPKPLARICGKPVLEYIFDLLIRHNFEGATLTLGYMASMIEDKYASGLYRQLPVNAVVEDKPRGTAGGVKLALSNWESVEAFLVISGDAITDFNLTRLKHFHEEKAPAVTIAGYRVSDPREYGLMTCDPDGRVRGFVEKPAWGQVTTDLANTGMYIIRPDVMDLVPDSKPFDFAKDLFPLLMERGEAIYACPLDGYWCDIGDLEAYRTCQIDLLRMKAEGKGAFSLPASAPIPANAAVTEPVWLGEEVHIAEGAVVGPDTVLENGVVIAPAAKVRHSVVLENAQIESNASLTGAIIGEGASVRQGASIYEGAALGTAAVVGAFASVQPGVLIWPGKQADPHSVLTRNLKFGTAAPTIFSDNGVGGAEGVLLSPEFAAAVGAAIGSVKAIKKVGVASDGSPFANALLYSLIGGLMQTGSHVWNFGSCFEAQLSFFTGFCALGMGVYVKGGEAPELVLCGEGGLPLPRYIERDIEAKYRRAEYKQVPPADVNEYSDMRGMAQMYARELLKEAPDGLEGVSAQVESPNPLVQEMLTDVLTRLGCDTTSGQVLVINEAGTEVTVRPPDAQVAANQNEQLTDCRLTAVCCRAMFEEGKDVALPYDAPEMVDDMALEAGHSVYRYMLNPADQTDAAARRMAQKQVFVRDALFKAVRALSAARNAGKSLQDFAHDIPDFCVKSKRFVLPVPPSKISGLFSDSDAVEPAAEGIRLRKSGGRLLITPSKNGKAVRVLAEAMNIEIADELMADFGELLATRNTQPF